MRTYQKTISEGLKNLGIIKEHQIQEALKLQRSHRRRLGQALVELGFIASENIASSLVSQFGISPVNLKAEQIPQEAIELVSYELAALHRVVPVKVEKGILTLATDNLFNFLAVNNLQKFLQNEIEMIYVREDSFNSCLDKIYGEKDKKKEKPTASEFLRQAQSVTGKDEAPIVKLVSLLLEEAYQNRASDVHLEPLEERFRIRYRIDGVLHEVAGPPKRLQGSLISRVKIMAGMDIAEKRLPQDGRIKFSVDNKKLDLRVSTLPALHGESVVVRILDRSQLVLDLEKLGFSPQNKVKYEDLIKLPNGIILVTGPTGCGKTTTLYTSLSQINKPNKKLLTLEDPVEYQLTGVNQVQVKPEIGLTFASGLRSMLRQAPDIIMVGEIRDYETAAIAVQASLTGHLIFSTLHTNDASGAITRLIDMGVKPYLVASTIQGILAQRLIRTLCSKCKKPYTPSKDELEAFNKSPDAIKGITFYQANGCPECNSSGFKGRIGILELLILDGPIRNLISENVVASKIRQAAENKGMRTLRQDGWLKATEGITTLAEVLRVTQQ
ncbi:MAG: Flp pilus assembly complex ATPase component TadA [Omnitrophica bacterium]|nr:Flp pilus assembly complex ATPase component TadA [Candidatus Omnitrophota bacterium]